MSADLGYFSTTQPDQLKTAMDNTVSMVELLSGATFPDPATAGKHYTVIVAYGTSREEVCTVTAKPTVSMLTVIRGQDGTPATAKNVGDVVVHAVSARDFRRIDTIESSQEGIETEIEDLTTNKLDKRGDTMTGQLVLAGDPLADLDATPKKYVDRNLLQDGSEPMTGPLVLPGDPTLDTQAATKHYTDTTAATAVSDRVKIDGSTPMTGNLKNQKLTLGVVGDGTVQGLQHGLVGVPGSGTGGPAIYVQERAGQMVISGGPLLPGNVADPEAIGTITLRVAGNTDIEYVFSPSGLKLPGFKGSAIGNAEAEDVPWLRGTRTNHSIPNTTWTQASGFTLIKNGNITSTSGLLNVPTGTYLLTVRVSPSAAGRVICSADKVTDNTYGGQTAYLFDSRAASANDTIAGSRLLFTDQQIRFTFYTTPAMTLDYVIEAVKVGGRNAS